MQLVYSLFLQLGVILKKYNIAFYSKMLNTTLSM